MWQSDKGGREMKIIKEKANENGSRPALQEWSGQTAPKGYAWCLDEFVSVFYSTTPSGFVNIEVEDDTVIEMTVNEEALAEYVESLPEPTDPEPTAQDDTDAMLVDHELRLTMLELGV
jgi:hypothetical protein